MDTLSERLLWLRKDKRMTQSELGKRLDISTSNISRIENGDVSPSAEIIRRLSQFFKVSADWLLTGEDPDEEARGGEMVEVRVYDEPAAAGFGAYLSGDDPYEITRFSAIEVPASTDFGIRVKGDSMEPKIRSGDILFIKSTPQIETGEIGVFVYDEKAYCKKLYFDRERRILKLVSLNPNYASILVKNPSKLRTIGRFLGLYRE